jgi:hypothetical protein
MSIELRVANLKRRFPAAHISNVIYDEDLGADIVCWDCHPTEVWVWEVREDDGSEGDTVVPELAEHLEVARRDPRAAGKVVRPGPNAVFEPAEERAADPLNYAVLVDVRNGRADGVQVYRRERQEDMPPDSDIERMFQAKNVMAHAAADAERCLRELGGR